MTSFVVIIPARWHSQRLPGKPLADICGEPMIRRVVGQAQKSKASRIVVATDHEAVVTALRGSNCETVMTSPELQSGTDRLASAADYLALDEGTIVVNLQGDEPLMPPECLDEVAEGLVRSNADMATLACRFDSSEMPSDENSVKVVTTEEGRALYFSRALIPFDRDGIAVTGDAAYRRHIGLYAYRVNFLKEFVHWPCGQLENLEKLEQLRALQRGRSIQVLEAPSIVPPGVDTERDLAIARAHYQELNK